MENITYKEFIENIIKTRGRHGCKDEYYERHHIIPRCMGGGNNTDNLVDLFAREHFEAHRLLALENPNNNKLIYAWHQMSIMNDVHGRCYTLSSDEYEEARIAYVNIIREVFKGDGNPFYGKTHAEETKQKISQAHTGKKHTEESKHNMSQSKMGDKNHFYGKKHTIESKNQMSESSSGKNNGRSKSVYCNELNRVFGSTREAERETGICYRSIVYCANGKQKHAGKHPITGDKLTWIYVYDKKIKNDMG